MAAHAHDNESSPLLMERGNLDDAGHHTHSSSKRSKDYTLALKIGAAMVSFTSLGLFNSSIGAILPSISRYYSLTDLHVSLLFLASPSGYIFAAQFNDAIHWRFGQCGIAIIGPLFQLVATLMIALHPRFGWVLVAFALQGLGMGLLDGSWCAWAGSMEKANTISGLLHGSYSVGAAAGPFLVTLITTSKRPWYLWYYVLLLQTLAELLVLTIAFWNETASVYRQSKQTDMLNSKTDAKAIFRHRATWLCAAYFLTYVGTETAISGWVVSFMLRNRNATPYLASLASSGFWTGMAIGRLVLGFGTDRIGVRRATVLYFLCAGALEVLFALLTSPIVSVVLMTFLGFVMGPVFPSGVVVLTRLLPADLHIAAVSFVASLGQVGGAILPFAIGAVVQSLGIGVFRYAILVPTILSLAVWVALARVRITVSAGETREETPRED